MGLILRGMLALPLLFMLTLIIGAGFQTIEPVYQSLSGLNHLGNMGSLMLMTTVSLIALPLVVILWWWMAPLRRDVRQDVR